MKCENTVHLYKAIRNGKGNVDIMPEKYPDGNWMGGDGGWNGGNQGGWMGNDKDGHNMGMHYKGYHVMDYKNFNSERMRELLTERYNFRDQDMDNFYLMQYEFLKKEMDKRSDMMSYNSIYCVVCPLWRNEKFFEYVMRNSSVSYVLSICCDYCLLMLVNLYCRFQLDDVLFQ